jgi:hypothetical protein
MKDISSDTQMVLDAIHATYEVDELSYPTDEQIAAAVLRALVKIDNIKAEPLGPCDESFGDYFLVASISQRDYRYELALHKNKVQVSTERKLLAIANELENI